MTIPISPTAREPVSAPPPPLESGDRLTAAEFERRYRAMPRVKKAELIERVVYIPSPVRMRQHGKPHAQLVTWLGIYFARTPGLEDFADNTTLRLDDDNTPQPDLLLRLPESAGGQVAHRGRWVRRRPGRIRRGSGGFEREPRHPRQEGTVPAARCLGILGLEGRGLRRRLVRVAV